MLAIDPKTCAIRDLHQYILGSITPRPIALVSTVDKNGNPNLAPFSFFNGVSSNPPILYLSVNLKPDGSPKDTLINIEKTGELVINIVTYEMVRQMAITGVQFPSGVNEFHQSGLTPVTSTVVKPFRVRESPVHFECKLKQIIKMGNHAGAGNLVIADVLKIHVREDILDESNRINPQKMGVVGRLGRSHYVRVSNSNIFTVVQPIMKIPIGYEQLPSSIKASTILSANDIAQLAGLLSLPSRKDMEQYLSNDKTLHEILQSKDKEENLHRYIQSLLASEETEKAGMVAFFAGNDM